MVVVCVVTLWLYFNCYSYFGPEMIRPLDCKDRVDSTWSVRFSCWRSVISSLTGLGYKPRCLPLVRLGLHHAAIQL